MNYNRLLLSLFGWLCTILLIAQTPSPQYVSDVAPSSSTDIFPNGFGPIKIGGQNVLKVGAYYDACELKMRTNAEIQKISFTLTDNIVIPSGHTVSVWMRNSSECSLNEWNPWLSVLTSATFVGNCSITASSVSTNKVELTLVNPIIYAGFGLEIYMQMNTDLSCTGFQSSNSPGNVQTWNTNTPLGYTGNLKPNVSVTYQLPTLDQSYLANTVGVQTCDGSTTFCPGEEMCLSLAYAGGSGLQYPDFFADASLSFKWYAAPTGGTALYSPIGVPSISYIPTSYSVSYATNSTYEEITNVTLGTLNQSSTCGATAPGSGSIPGAYSDYTSGSGLPNIPNLSVGSHTLSVSVTSCTALPQAYCAAYIDLNHDGDFFDLGENVFTSGLITSSTTLSQSITIPIYAINGRTKLRVIFSYLSAASPMGTYSYGETEDYWVNITNASSARNSISFTPSTDVSVRCRIYDIATGNYVWSNPIVLSQSTDPSAMSCYPDPEMSTSIGSRITEVVVAKKNNTTNIYETLLKSLTNGENGLSTTDNFVLARTDATLPLEPLNWNPIFNEYYNFADFSQGMVFTGLVPQVRAGDDLKLVLKMSKASKPSMFNHIARMEFDWDADNVFESFYYYSLSDGQPLFSLPPTQSDFEPLTLIGPVSDTIRYTRFVTVPCNALPNAITKFRVSLKKLPTGWDDGEDYAIKTLCPVPRITYVGNPVICPSGSKMLTAVLTCGGSGTYQWQKGGVDISGANSSTYTATTAGVYTVVFTTTSGTCSEVSESVTLTVVTPAVPTILPSGPLSFCQGGNVTLSVTTSYSSYAWSNGATLGSILVSTAGTYYVTVTDVNGCTAVSSNTTVSVIPNLTPSLTIATGTTSICSGASITFTATPTNGGSSPSYQWKLNGVNVGTNSTSYTNATLANGDVVTCVMTANNTCQTSSTATSNALTMTVTANVTPSLTIATGSTSICSGASITFTATPTNGGSTPSYQWKLNGVNVGTNSTSYTNSALVNGDVVTCVMTANNTCQTSSTATSNALTMTVTANVTPSLTIATGSTSICSGASITFTATPTNGGSTPSYQWKLNGVNVGTNSTSYTNATLANGDVVTCVMTANNTCQTSSTATSNALTMTVTANVTPSLTIATGSTSICSGASITFTATPTNGGSSPSYQWKLNGVNVGTNSTSYTNSALVNGDVVTCVMTANNTCQTSSTATSNALTMTVTANVTPSLTIATGSTSICSGASITFTATPTNGGSTPSYQWKLNGVNVGTNSTSYTNATLANGDVVTCVMTANNTCQTSSTATSNALTMTVTANVTPSLTIATGSTSICSSASITFTATPTNGGSTPSYQWKLNGVNVGTNSTSYTNATLANGDVVTCVMTANNTCQTSSTATSNALTMTVTASVTPSLTIATGSTSICSGALITFTATPTNGGSSPSYQWKLNGVNVGINSTSYTNSALVNGDVVTCVMTANNTCQTSSTATSNALTMTVTANVTPSLTIATGSTSICSGASITFTATPTNGGSTPSYQWKLNGVNVGTNSTSYTNSALVNGDVVTCVMTANNTCQTSSTATSNALTMTVTANQNYYLDSDADGYGNSASSITTCTLPPMGYVLNATDCDDGNSAINVGAAEICNGIDDNCNSLVDDGLVFVNYYNDIDADGFGSGLLSNACSAPLGGVLNNLDCNDALFSVNPSMSEICNSVDDNCNSLVDDGLVFVNYYNDIDADGFGSGLLSNTCSAPLGGVLNNLDCNDGLFSVNPSVTEICNAIDDDCDGTTDEGCPISGSTLISAVLMTVPQMGTVSGANSQIVNMALQGDSPECAGTYNEKWFKFVAISNAIRVGVTGATSSDDNLIRLYNSPPVGYVSPLVPIAQEDDVNLSSVGVFDTGDETLLLDNLVIGQTYYCVIATIAGTPGNITIRFNSLLPSECDNSIYTGGTNTFSNTCQNFKCRFRPNAQAAVVNRWSTSSMVGIPDWSYQIPSTTSINTVCQVGKITAPNMTGATQVVYVSVDVKYNLPDAAGNNVWLTAESNSICSFNLNSEADIHVRSTDQCPAFKSVTSTVATDRSVCGTQQYQWKFTQAYPVVGLPIFVTGGVGSRILPLSAIPGIVNGQRYDVNIRTLHLDLISYSNWSSGNDCVKTIGAAGIPFENNEAEISSSPENGGVTIFPNPSLQGSVQMIISNEGWVMGELLDQYGNVVLNKQWYHSANTMHTMEIKVSPGMYHWRLKQNDQIYTLRWVKQ